MIVYREIIGSYCRQHFPCIVWVCSIFLCHSSDELCKIPGSVPNFYSRCIIRIIAHQLTPILDSCIQTVIELEICGNRIPIPIRIYFFCRKRFTWTNTVPLPSKEIVFTNNIPPPCRLNSCLGNTYTGRQIIGKTHSMCCRPNFLNEFICSHKILHQLRRKARPQPPIIITATKSAALLTLFPWFSHHSYIMILLSNFIRDTVPVLIDKPPCDETDGRHSRAGQHHTHELPHLC